MVLIPLKTTIPPIPGLADVDYLTNETIFDRDELPKHLLVVGTPSSDAEKRAVSNRRPRGYELQLKPSNPMELFHF